MNKSGGALQAIKIELTLKYCLDDDEDGVHTLHRNDQLNAYREDAKHNRTEWLLNGST